MKPGRGDGQPTSNYEGADGVYIYKKNLKWNGDDRGGGPSNAKRIREPI